MVDTIKRTFSGDANLDGEFNSGDFVFVFTRGEYEDGVALNSGWADGDWDGNMEFDSGDFVAAFTVGAYEKGPRPAVSSVPEPSAILLALVSLLGLIRLKRRRSRCRV
jgi:hypothetical protein